MKPASRRDFLKTSTGFMSLLFAGDLLANKKQQTLLSFSTLGCPDWTFADILNFASRHRYSGIEIRGIQRQLDLIKCPEFSSAEQIARTIRQVEDKHLKIVDLGSSAEMHHTDKTERQKNLDEAKRFIDLAGKINCPYVRVFPNKLPDDDARAAVIEVIIENLAELGNYAKGTNVSVLMESHGDAVKTKELKMIMESVNHPQVGLVWDIVNMWSVTKEPPARVYNELKAYIRHTHIKDLVWVDGKEKYVHVGKGETPIFEAIDILYKNGYTGYYSFEWEKLWHPDIGSPDEALADYPLVMQAHFAKK
jgi:sugar phosphate isomerase/epimerase